MIGCLRTRVRKQPIIALHFESENELKFYNLEARTKMSNSPSYQSKDNIIMSRRDVMDKSLALYTEMPSSITCSPSLSDETLSLGPSSETL